MGIRSDTLLGAERGLKGTPYSHLVIHLSVYRISQTGHKTGREMYCSDTIKAIVRTSTPKCRFHWLRDYTIH